MITHVLKCWPQPFSDLLSGVKTHEFRLNDRDYQPGDMLKLCCFDPAAERYTGAELQRQVTHVLRDGFGLPAGYAVLSLSACLIDDLPQEFSLNLETLEVMAETAAAAGDIASDTAPADHPRKPFSIAELSQEQDEFISLMDPASALQLIALARRHLIGAGPTLIAARDLNAERYLKLRRWMSSNVPEGWDTVEQLGAVAAWLSWSDFDQMLDNLPECNVGQCGIATLAADEKAQSC